MIFSVFFKNKMNGQTIYQRLTVLSIKKVKSKENIILHITDLSLRVGVELS